MPQPQNQYAHQAILTIQKAQQAILHRSFSQKEMIDVHEELKHLQTKLSNEQWNVLKKEKQEITEVQQQVVAAIHQLEHELIQQQNQHI